MLPFCWFPTLFIIYFDLQWFPWHSQTDCDEENCLFFVHIFYCLIAAMLIRLNELCIQSISTLRIRSRLKCIFIPYGNWGIINAFDRCCNKFFFSIRRTKNRQPHSAFSNGEHRQWWRFWMFWEAKE